MPLVELDLAVLLVLLGLLVPLDPLERMVPVVPVETLDQLDLRERMAWLDHLVWLAREDLLENLAPLVLQDLQDLRVSLDLRESVVSPEQEASVVSLVVQVVSVRLAEPALLVPLVLVVPLVTLACLV